ncbi:MAG: SDR family oxidoreductase [Elusimicrobiota bacterium]
MRLEGKTALVTGAARRVGRVIAQALARRGAAIAIHYNRSRKDARALADRIRRTSGVETALFKADLSSPAQVRTLARSALRRFGTVHVLVNNAAIWERTPFGRVTPADWDAHLDINLRAPFLLAQALGPAMRKAGYGKIVNIADWAGQRPYPDYIPYCVSKGALLALNAALAKALAPEVQVNAVLPGPVLPPEGAGAGFRKAAARATLVRRLGSPEDIARAALFLIEGTDFATGAALPVDGGRSLA